MRSKFCKVASAYAIGIRIRPVVATATAALIVAGVITENIIKVIHKGKVKGAQKRLVIVLGQEFEKCKEEGEICIFDGRIDITSVMMDAECSDQYFSSVIREEDYCVVSQPGSYLVHFIPEKATSLSGKQTWP